MPFDMLQAFVKGRLNTLEVHGIPSSQGIANLRKLDKLGFLNDQMVWGLISQAQVDPLYLIEIFRKHKKEIGFHPEEHHLGDTLVFLAGDRENKLYQVAYHVNIYTNDTIVMTRRGTEYITVLEQTAEDVYNRLKDIAVGELRLKALLDLVKMQIQDAYKKTQDISENKPQ